MRATGPRRIEPELLDDDQSADAPCSVHDLARINRYFGGRRIARSLIRRAAIGLREFTVLDVGAASGDLGRAMRKECPGARVYSFDYRIAHLTEAPAPKITGDAFQPPFAPGSFDFVFTSLFLHHFSNERIIELLRKFNALARRGVMVIDLERGPGAFAFIPATNWVFRWNRLTRHDGPISVEAAFKLDELRALCEQAGLRNIEVARHRPWARLSVLARK